MMTKMILALATLVGTQSLAGTLSEDEVRSICLGHLNETISCTATVEGEVLTLEIPQKDLQPMIVKYSNSEAIYGFNKKVGFFFSYPQWQIRCHQKTGEFQGASYIIRSLIDVNDSVSADCR